MIAIFTISKTEGIEFKQEIRYYTNAKWLKQSEYEQEDILYQTVNTSMDKNDFLDLLLSYIKAGYKIVESETRESEDDGLLKEVKLK